MCSFQRTPNKVILTADGKLTFLHCAYKLQESLCKLQASTVAMQEQVSGPQTSSPNRRPTTTLMASSPNLSPHAEIGNAKSKLLLC